MIENPIVDEVHRIREQWLAKHNGDLHALILEAKVMAAQWRKSEPAASSPPESHGQEVPAEILVKH